MVNVGLEKQRFDVLNGVWRNDFKTIFNSGNYNSLSLSPKHVRDNQIYISNPLVRRMASSRTEHSGTKQNGIIQYENQIASVVQVVCSNNLEGDFLQIGPKSYDDFKQTLIVRSGNDILNKANRLNVNICGLEDRINDLGEEFSKVIKTDSGRRDFLRGYLELCSEFSDEINYNSYLEKVDCLNPERI